MARFHVEDLPLAGLKLVERQLAEDARGFFSRFYCSDELGRFGFDHPIAQVNHTRTRQAGTVRGMHFQRPPDEECKLVSCLRGEIFDVAVDLRRDSPTFLSWHGVILSEANHRSMLIPKGFAHGFQTLEEDCELMYLHSSAYVPAAEGALHARDPRIGIRWPLPVAMLSERDSRHPYVDSTFFGI